MFDPWVGKIPWIREWLPTPVFLPGEFHGQRILVGYSPRGCKELGTTETEELYKKDLHEHGVNCHVISNRNIEGFWSFNVGKFWIQYCGVIRDFEKSL